MSQSCLRYFSARSESNLTWLRLVLRGRRRWRNRSSWAAARPSVNGHDGPLSRHRAVEAAERPPVPTPRHPPPTSTAPVPSRSLGHEELLGKAIRPHPPRRYTTSPLYRLSTRSLHILPAACRAPRATADIPRQIVNVALPGRLNGGHIRRPRTNCFRDRHANPLGNGLPPHGVPTRTRPVFAGSVDVPRIADQAERGVRVTGAVPEVFLNDAVHVVDSWLVGAGVFPPGSSGDR